ncbi:TRADD-N-associated membrane domain-containing protein [Nocardia sp. NPDC055165]|uniref:TRADD-N-associated membrane domain-containing protein n=1 Tax=unclassified Nocardia TaxID=2637762 RepID=UPI003665938A
MDEVLALIGVGGLIPTMIAAVSAWFSATFSRRVSKRAIEVTMTGDTAAPVVSEPADPATGDTGTPRRRTEEYLRQVRSAMAQSTAFFWAYMISGCCGVVVVLAAASMVAFGNRDAAAATSIMGAVPVGITALFYKRSTDLDKIVGENLTRLSKADEIAEANRAAHDVVSRMGVGADQDRLLAMIGVRQLFPSATPTEVAELLRTVPVEAGTVTSRV